MCETYATNPERISRLRAIQADGGAVAGGANVLSLAQELATLLADPDPEVRDGLAFELLYTWIQQQRVLDAQALKVLAESITPALHVPRAEGDHLRETDPCVYGRSFAALALSLIAARDVEEAFFSAQELHANVVNATRYAAEEFDFRGHTEQGWAHAAAHLADWLAALARNPRLTSEDAQSLLTAVGRLVLRPHGFVLHHGEDGRLTQPVAILLQRDALSATFVEAWLQEFVQPFRESMSADPTQALYARQRNARNMLFTLFVTLSLEKQPSAAAQSALAAVRTVLTSV
jgi:hypothetical protein